MNGSLAIAASNYASNISTHKHESDDEEFHLILDSVNDKAVRNQVYKDIVGLVNELNTPMAGADVYYGNHTLSSIALPSNQEILSISGVTVENYQHVSTRIMNIMQQKGYAAAQNAY